MASLWVCVYVAGFVPRVLYRLAQPFLSRIWCPCSSHLVTFKIYTDFLFMFQKTSSVFRNALIWFLILCMYSSTVFLSSPISNTVSHLVCANIIPVYGVLTVTTVATYRFKLLLNFPLLTLH